MPTYDGIGSSVTHEIEVVGDVFISNVEGGSLSTQVPFEIFSNVSGLSPAPTDSRQLRLRVQPTSEASPDDSYVTDMGIQNTTDNYFFITAPQNTSNVGDQNTFVISSTSNVGIGTTDPIESLHVYNNDTNGIQLRIENANQSGRTGLGIVNSAGQEFNIQHVGGATATSNAAIIENFSTVNGGIHFYNKGDGDYIFRTTDSNTERMRILNGGNVGIGTASPAAPIEIVSTRTTNTWSSGQSYMNILHDNGSSTYYGMSFGVSSFRGNGCIQTFNKNSGGVSYALELQPSGGRVGIGTTQPSVPFHVYGVNNNQCAYFQANQHPVYNRIIGDVAQCLIGADGSGFSANEPTSIAIFNTSTGYINLLTNGARRALLTGAGQFQAQSFGIYSDKRLKDNITDIDDENSLEIIRNLKPKTFVTKEIKDVKRWGFVADEVEEIVPEAIETNSSSDQYIKKSYDATWLPDGTVSALITDEVFEVGDCLKLTPDLNGLKICSVHVKSVSENVYTFEDAGCMVADDMDIKDLADDTQIHIRSKQIHNVKVLNREFIDPVMVSAMQQMLRRIESLEARLATFENNSA